ncbi:MAG TPA: hypothetical protein VFQ92_10990, partial [Blastocatellia bacterium]|nr:hypothetical protein [Blastocatellia bacterium]
FRSEATEIAEIMTVVSGTQHWLIETEMECLLNTLVRFNDKELIIDVWNIRAVGDGFEADALIEGQLYKVQHLFPFEPWSIVADHSKAGDTDEGSEQAGLTVEPVSAEIVSPIAQPHNSAKDEGGRFDPAPVPK